MGSEMCIRDRPTLMLVAAGLFVMFASPPTVNYDEVESAGKRLGNEIMNCTETHTF